MYEILTLKSNKKLSVIFSTKLMVQIQTPNGIRKFESL
jgi:hypothetical protein